MEEIIGIDPADATAMQSEATQSEAEEESIDLTGDIDAAKPPETDDAKIVREYDQERHDGRITRMGKYTASAKAERVEQDKDVSGRKAWQSQRPDEPKGLRGIFKKSEFEREKAAWQKVDQAFEKRIGEREKRIDRLEKLGRNQAGATVREVMADMEKANPGRTAKVEAARDRENERRLDESWKKTKEQIAERKLGKGIDQGHDQGIG